MSNAIGTDLAAEISGALEATERFGPRFTIVHEMATTSRTNLLLEVDVDGSTTANVWCRSTPASVDNAFDGRFTLRREAVILAALSRSEIPVPQVLGMSDTGRTLIQSYVEPTEPATVDILRSQTARYLETLDRVHLLDPRGVVPDRELDGRRSTRELISGEQQDWLETVVRLVRDESLDNTRIGEARTRLCRIRDWLIDTPIPEQPYRAVLVHGDAGRANFITGATGEVWLLDWELAHAGSPLEDYAWIELRGLEQDDAGWRSGVMQRLRRRSDQIPTYEYFRTAIYFRSVIAIAARICAAPGHSGADYLRRRFAENELLGWMCAGEPHRGVAEVHDPGRLQSWQRWSDDLAMINKDRSSHLRNSEERQ